MFNMNIKRILIPLLMLLFMLSMIVSGAPTYVNIGPTTEFTGDIGIPVGFNYYIGDTILDITWMASGWTFTHMEDTLFFGAFSNIYYVKFGNLDATSAPTVNDDVDLDYVVGSRWIDVTADKEYICLDNNNGVAVWIETTGAAAGGYTDLTEFVDQNTWKIFYSDGSGDVIELALGADGTYLESKGAAAAPEFTVPAGAGDVLKVGTPVDSQVGVWTGDGTIEGAATLTYDGSNLQLTGDIGSTGTKITKGWFTDLLVTNAIAGSITGNAATLTITDNESTAENNAILFTSGGDLDGGNLGIESDGDFHYNPSTGIVTATIFVGEIRLVTSDADPDTTGEIKHDSTVTGMSGGALRWFDNDSSRILVDLETDPSTDDYVVAYDADADGFYMKQDADSGGATAWDDIGNPDAADEIDFASYIIELNVVDFRVGDGGDNYIKFADAGAVTLIGTATIESVDATEFGYLDGITAFGASIIDDADEATFKATVNLEIGTDVLAEQTIGIADDNLLEVDDADAADNDYAKFTANGLEGRSYAEVMMDTTPVTTSATTNTLTVDEAGLVLVSDAHTETLPTASGNAGLTYTFLKTDWDYDLITLEGDGAETFNYENSTGSPNLTYLRLNTPLAEVTIVSDDTNWQVTNEAMGQVPECEVYLGTNQLNITNDTWVVVDLDTEVYDIGSNFNTSTHQFTAPISGKYQINAAILYSDVAADKLYKLVVREGGDAYDFIPVVHSSTTNQLTVALSKQRVLAASEYVELVGRNTSAGTSDYYATYTLMQIKLISKD